MIVFDCKVQNYSILLDFPGRDQKLDTIFIVWFFYEPRSSSLWPKQALLLLNFSFKIALLPLLDKHSNTHFNMDFCQVTLKRQQDQVKRVTVCNNKQLDFCPFALFQVRKKAVEKKLPLSGVTRRFKQKLQPPRKSKSTSHIFSQFHQQPPLTSVELYWTAL